MDERVRDINNYREKQCECTATQTQHHKARENALVSGTGSFFGPSLSPKPSTGGSTTISRSEKSC